jgi:hypothetical protein
MDIEGGMGVDALEHIHQVDIRVHALQAARRDQARYDADIARARFRPAEEPRLRERFVNGAASLGGWKSNPDVRTQQI